MRRGVTLIELIITMVIVGLVFMVVPKIVFVTNKSFETIVKEDALYNAMALMGIVIHLPWDEENTKMDQILSVSSGHSSYTCDTTTGFYRIGGFKGSRNCIDNSVVPMNASSAPGREDAFFNDIDDYDGYRVETATPAGAKYRLDVGVRYLADPAPGNSVDLSVLSPASGSTNVKEINVTVSNAPGRKKAPFSTSIFYHSVNIGQVYVNKRAWR
ncbi:type II secretion system protein [Hydrogenimonas sp.]|uniref:type II secretion system protein n=1 Tax=Hydrogenimonas sp. TaxID=2231112 RepID=UPI0026399937|nr:prepilin-type N-terminal cleavage/methylation domain-containing protein [Hydrogenimonas sp.]